MTTDCITNPSVAKRYAARQDPTISLSEWVLLTIIGGGFLLMLPAAAFLVSHLTV
ncbi:MAG TPA: hypothetical protein VGH86_09325 [Phenylobacterium sp.]|jgi:hypothetical protein